MVYLSSNKPTFESESHFDTISNLILRMRGQKCIVGPVCVKIST